MTARFVARCDCTWRQVYRTEGMAEYGLRRHSCEKRRAILAATHAASEREQAVDRTSKPCLHKVARHTHGTHSCYVLDRCRCVPCAAATSVYNTALIRRNAYGRSNYVDAQPSRDHVNALTTARMGLKRIALHDGVSHGALWKLMYGRTKPDGTRTPSKRVTVATERAILAIPMPTVADLGATVVVDSTGTRRRLEALIALGWSVQRLADDYTLDRQALDSALAWVPVQAKTAVTVKAMFETIGDQRAPETTHRERISAARSRNRSQAKDWAPPAAWDDDDLDDPYAADPTPGDAPRGVDLDEWVHLVSGGVDPEEAAQRCGTTIRGVVEAATAHADRPALWLLAVHAATTASTDGGATAARRMLTKARAA